MHKRVATIVAGLVGATLLAGCVGGGVPVEFDPRLAPVPSVEANRAPRGSAAYCERYALQTRNNTYNDIADPRDGFGSNSFAYRRADRRGADAYERCLRGRRG